MKPRTAFHAREMLSRCGMGMGSVALTRCSATGPSASATQRRAIESAGAEAAAAARQGQARAPPLHERRRVARRHLRSQAVARQVRGQTDPDHAEDRAAHRRGLSFAVHVPQVRPERDRGERDLFRTSADASTTSASSARCTPISRTTSRR